MSLITEIFPQCDVCHEVNKDMDGKTKEAVRRTMKANGWTVARGQDVCDTCNGTRHELPKGVLL